MGSLQRGAGGAPLDRRYQLKSLAANVYQDGIELATAIIAGQANTMTSAGAVGPYTINFSPVVFAAAPRVAAWCAKESGGNPVLMNIDSVSALAFTFDLIIPASSAAINVGHTCLVEWVAIGS